MPRVVSPIELITMYDYVLLDGREVSPFEAIEVARSRGCVTVELPGATVYRVRHGGAVFASRGADYIVPVVVCEDGYPVYYDYIVFQGRDADVGPDAEKARGLPVCPWTETLLLRAARYSSPT